jgi:nitrogen-specific signal transduction histidine kinase
MRVLADFAAMGIRHQRQQKLVTERAGAAAAAIMANDLAHSINNPLQSLTNLLYLATEGNNGEEARGLAQQAFRDLQRLSGLVQKLLALPGRKP